jgi:hypothetical protein
LNFYNLLNRNLRYLISTEMLKRGEKKEGGVCGYNLIINIPDLK